MKFFVPQVTRSKAEENYEEIAKSVKDQLRLPITESRIFSINYVHDKKRCRAEVGKPEPQQGRYDVVAIFESKPYIVFTRGKDGAAGLTILVSNDEITDIEYFD